MVRGSVFAVSVCWGGLFMLGKVSTVRTLGKTFATSAFTVSCVMMVMPDQMAINK